MNNEIFTTETVSNAEAQRAERTADKTGSVTGGSRFSFTATSAFILAIAACGATTWHWLVTRLRLNPLEQVLTLRLEQFGENNQRALTASKPEAERSIEATARISLLEQKLAESRNQQEALQTL